MSKQLLSRSLCLLLAILLLIPSVPSMAFAQSVEQAMPVTTFFSEEAQEAFATQEVVDVLLFMPDKPQVAVAVQQMEDITGHELDKVQERTAVIGELKQVAMASQYNLLQDLSAAQTNGQIEVYEDFYIVNAIRVKGDRNTVAELIKKHQVEKVFENGRTEMIMPTVDENAAPMATDDNIEWNIKHILADKAWNEHGVDGTGVVIGMIDSGVQWDHPALKAKFRGTGADGNLVEDIDSHWFNAQDPTNKVPVDDPQVPHGSHVMGTMVGSEPDGTNRIGVAPGAKFIVAKALSAMGGSDAELLAAAEWMLAPGDDPANAPDLINNSWGGGASKDLWFQDVLTRWREANIMPLHAAGNQRAGEPLPWPGSLSNPANLMNNFAVAAIDKNNVRGSFSYIGPSLFDDTKSVPKPDISAPGVNIRSSVIGSGYASGWNGTSMATPAVAGTVALMLEANPDLKVAEIEAILKKTAMPISDGQFPTTPNMGYGYGNVNAFDAVSEVTGRGTGLITGKVLLSKNDTQAPEFTMDYPAQNFENRDLPITFRIKDDIVTTQTTFMYRQAGAEDWTSVELLPVEGDVIDGTYQFTIPAADVRYPNIETKIVLNDFGRNIESQMLAIPVIKGIVPGYSNSFEGDMYGWILEDYWNVGTPANALEPTPITGTKVLGTYVGSSWPMPHPGRYPIPENPEDAPIDDDGGPEDPGLLPLNGEFSALLPPIDMREVAAEDAVMSWKQFLKNPESVVTVVEYQAGPEEWVELAKYASSDTDWEDASLDLSQFAGNEDGLQLRFRYKIENEVYARGWYIEDLLLGQTAQPTADLTQVSAEIDFVDQVVPLNGTVRLLEMNRLAKSDIRGDYSIRTSADTNTMTLRAEAYGYFPQERSVVISKDVVLTEDFIMQPKTRGNLDVVVKDQAGQVVEGAVAILMEEPQAGTATSSANGTASFGQVYEGEYTVRVYKPGFMPTLRPVAIYPGDTTTVEIVLNMYTGDAVLHQYDEFVPDWVNSLTWLPAEAGMTMKFVAETSGLVSQAQIYYVSNPSYTGDTVKIGLFTVADGRLVTTKEPFEYTVTKDQWNVINLEEFGIFVEEGQSFYVASIQTKPGHLSPAIGTMWVPNPLALERSFAMYPDWSLEPFESLNVYQSIMMKATVKHGTLEQATPAPKLDQPYLKYVNDPKQTVTGTTEVAGSLKVYTNDQVDSQTIAAGPFSQAINLTSEMTEVTATITPPEGVESVKSAPARFILDKVAPELSVTSHTDGEIVASEMIELQGTVSDKNLESLKINGRYVSVIDGTFAQYLTLTKGENVIELIARDKAGNETAFTMMVDFNEAGAEVPEILLTDPMPAVDTEVTPGQDVVLSVKSQTGLSGQVVVQAPVGLMSLGDSLTLNETAIGKYEATFTVPQDISGPLQVTYELTDGTNSAVASAPGQLIVVNDDIIEPINKVIRVSGQNRYETAVATSKQAFEQADIVLLANGINPIDGIVAGPLAIAKKAPILLTATERLTPVTLDEITRLQPKEIIIIGGEGVVSKAVEDALKADYSVTRLSGRNRMETALAVAEEVLAAAPANKAVLANQMAYSDVVAVGPVTGRIGSGVAPILLSGTDKVSDNVLAFLDKQAPEEVWLVGGEGVLAPSIETQLADYSPIRVSGRNRYETAAEIARKIDLKPTRIGLANGLAIVDSMCAAPLLAQENMVLLLSPEAKLPESVVSLLTPEVEQVYLLGGTGVLSDSIEMQVRQLIETR